MHNKVVVVIEFKLHLEEVRNSTCLDVALKKYRQGLLKLEQ
jgi:hypothetical protein